MTKRAFIILGFSIIVNIAGNRTEAADPTFVSTFNSISIYWLPADPVDSTGTQSIQYSVLGSGLWKTAQDLNWDSLSAEKGAEFRQFRGSIVFLKAGTQYDIDMTIGSHTFRDTISTWAETDNWTIKATTPVSGEQTGTYVVSTSGDATGYQLYDFSQATFEGAGSDTNIVIRADKVILRGAEPDANGNLATTLTGSGRFGIYIEAGYDSILIEHLDISGFGAADTNVDNNEGGIVAAQNCGNVFVFQYNKIHTPTGTSLAWLHRKDNTSATIHPGGPTGIVLNNPGENYVIRYNTIDGGGDNWSSLNVQRKFKDGITTGSDASFTGGFADTDIYGNLIENVYDDAMELDGRGENNRVFQNFTNNVYVSYSLASVSVGPTYLWRNISDSSRHIDYYDSTDAISDDWGRGQFIKWGQTSTNVSKGFVYVYHNTVLQDTTGGVTEGQGHKHFAKDNNNGFFYGVLRNNIVSLNDVATQKVMQDGQDDLTNTSDYNLVWTNGAAALYNCCGGNTTYSPSNDITAYPTFVTGTGRPNVSSGNFALQNGSSGEETGVVLAEMFQHNDNVDPAMGAMENGQNELEFGHTAYLNLQPGGGAVSGRYLIIDRNK